MLARVHNLPGVPSYLHLRPNRARTPDVAAAAARSMAAATRAPLRIEFSRVRARSGLLQHRPCVRLLPALPCQGLSKNPWTLATGWSWGGIQLSRGAPPTTPLGRGATLAAASLRIEFSRVRARSGLLQHRPCVRLLPALPCQGLSKNPWTLATGWSWGGIQLSRGAPPTTPLGRGATLAAASPKP